jgi:hypothetical protein
LQDEDAEEHVTTLYQSVGAADVDIRLAAGKFVIEHYFSRFSNENDEAIGSTSASSKGRRRKNKQAAQLHIQLRALLDFVFNHSLHPKVPEYTVDALWGGDLSVLKNWEAMVGGLGAQGEDLNPAEQYLLAQICRSAVQKSCGQSICAKGARETNVVESKDDVGFSGSFFLHVCSCVMFVMFVMLVFFFFFALFSWCRSFFLALAMVEPLYSLTHSHTTLVDCEQSC